MQNQTKVSRCPASQFPTILTWKVSAHISFTWHNKILPQKEARKDKKRDLSVWKEKTFVRNATIFNQSSFWTGRGLCFDAFCYELWYFPIKWHFQAKSSSCPPFLPPLNQAQQMVQIAWHRFIGSVLGGEPCQAADGFFEVVHSGNNGWLTAHPWLNEKTRHWSLKENLQCGASYLLQCPQLFSTSDIIFINIMC